jgi:CheY-like chemotaxis protein
MSDFKVPSHLGKKVMVKVLIVDDNPDNRFLTGRILKQLGCEVIEFPAANPALTLLNIANPFRVIFTDLHMPGIGGLEFLEQVKNRYPDAYIVATSSSPHPDLQEKALLKGASYCIFDRHTRDTYKAVLDTALKSN